MSTIHNTAKKSEISNLVLLTGDPLRSKYFADKFLTDCKMVNNVRGIHGYTGIYKDTRITIMGHGMGIGSMGIYSYELFDKEIYDVDCIVRMGSCGSLVGNLELNDLVVVKDCVSRSDYGIMLGFCEKVISANSKMLQIAESSAKMMDSKLIEVRNLTTDNFYSVVSAEELQKSSQCSTVEMESFALYVNAHFHKKDALTILTVADTNDKSKKNTDNGKKQELTPTEREQKLDNMFLVGATILINYSNSKK